MQHLESRFTEIAAQLDQVYYSKEEMEDTLTASISRARFDDLHNKWENAEKRVEELELEVRHRFCMDWCLANEVQAI